MGEEWQESATTRSQGRRGMRIVTAACAAALCLLVVAVVVNSDGPATSLAQAKAQLKQLVHSTKATQTKLDEEGDGGDSEEGDSSISIKDLYREVKELEKQEKAHFAARAKALQNALSKAPKTEQNTLKWKMAKDKYEQAAMADIRKEENARYNYTDEGQKMFEGYVAKAQNLLGIHEFNNLLNSTKTTEHARAQKEEATLSALRSASHQLRKIAKSERKLRDLKEKEKQEKINAEEQNQLKKSLAASQYGSSDNKKLEATAHAHDVKRQSDEVKVLKEYADGTINKEVSKASEESSRAPYARDEAQAKTIETQRMKAFNKEVQQLKEKTDKDRQARAKILAAEKKSEDRLEQQEKAEQAGLAAAEVKKMTKQEAKVDLIHKQMKEALGSGKAAPEVKKARHVHLEGGNVMSSKNYEESVENAIENSLKRTLEERRERAEYHKARNKLLAADQKEASRFSGSLVKKSDEILQKSQLADMPASDAADSKNVQRVVSARDKEVDMIMGLK